MILYSNLPAAAVASRTPSPRACENWGFMKRKLLTAMGAYSILAVLAAFTLDGGLLRNAVWILLAGLAAKTYIAYRAGKID